MNTSWGWPLVLGDGVTGGIEVSRYYDVFEYTKGSDNLFYNNLINWDDTKTTVSQAISSYSDWFDTNNIVDNMINYQLSLGLGLLSSGN